MNATISLSATADYFTLFVRDENEWHVEVRISIDEAERLHRGLGDLLRHRGGVPADAPERHFTADQIAEIAQQLNRHTMFHQTDERRLEERVRGLERKMAHLIEGALRAEEDAGAEEGEP